ncbi:MAG: DUF362 domain-containing protein [Anaerolineae bacterium]|nr:DUF362 domain-containing protein [Anaerolineae bacterium]
MKKLTRRKAVLNWGIAALALSACGGQDVRLATGEPEPAATPSVTPRMVPGRMTTPSPEATAAQPRGPTLVTPAREGTPYLVVARGDSPAAITEAAVTALGGMGRFVKPGDDVIVKPNICVAYHGPEYAATTNPEVVATIVRMVREAGAGRVRVMDYPFGGSAKDAYVVSGIQEAVERAGGEMELMAQVKYAEVDFPDVSRDIRRWVVYTDALEADVLINVPIAKHHGIATLTLGAKNLMGLIENRPLIHTNLHQRIADLVALFHPALTIMDAVRILTAHGPSGGRLEDVQQMNTVIASPDLVAVDAYTTRFFPFADTDKVAYIKYAAEMGLGTRDLDSVEIAEIEA